MYSLPPELKQPGFPATMAAITDGHFQPWLVTGLFPATFRWPARTCLCRLGSVLSLKFERLEGFNYRGEFCGHGRGGGIPEEKLQSKRQQILAKLVRVHWGRSPQIGRTFYDGPNGTVPSFTFENAVVSQIPVVPHTTLDISHSNIQI